MQLVYQFIKKIKQQFIKTTTKISLQFTVGYSKEIDIRGQFPPDNSTFQL